MNPTFPWLSLLVFLPLLGALLCVLRRHEAEECRALALATTLAVLGIAGWLFAAHGGAAEGWLLREDVPWIPTLGARYTLAMDGLSLLLLVLTAVLQVVAVLVSWPVRLHVPLFFALLLLMESGILGVFLATDLLLFYFFWELMLIPMFFLIGVWGHHRRLQAALKFFLYTLAGSLLLLLGLIALYLLHGSQSGEYSFALEALAATELSTAQGWWLYGAFLVAFAIKIPLVPLHTWLPDAHTEAPVAGSVDLAGLLLKTGIFGLIRFGFTLFPEPARQSLPVLAALALLGLFHASWGAYVQRDAKRLVAYSSVAHLGLVVLGLAACGTAAVQGSLLLMLSHGITTGGLFVLIALIESRAGTRRLGELGGVWGRAPILGAFFLLFSLSSLGLPGLANFTGEFLVLAGAFRAAPLWGVLGMAGAVFSAAYMLRMVQGVLWGPAADRAPWTDLTWREAAVLVPLTLLLLVCGLHPAPLLEPLAGPARLLVTALGGTP